MSDATCHYMRRTSVPPNLNPSLAVSTSTLGSSLGTGGMETKLIAAEIATAAGVTTVITSSKFPENILKIIEYNHSLKSSPGTPHEPVSAEMSIAGSESDRVPAGAQTPISIRPPHTLFKPSLTPLRDLKSWTKHTLFPSGSVIIDPGAHRVLSRRDSGGRLLPAGVTGIIGAFASGQAVRIVVRRHPDGGTPGDTDPASGSNVNSQSPITASPVLAPSRSSSGASLERQSRSFAEEASSQVQKTVDGGRLTDDEMNVVEIGRGLANYNSAQIDKVKGLNRCVAVTSSPPLGSLPSRTHSASISQLLGYADSEYVVENVTISVPP